MYLLVDGDTSAYALFQRFLRLRLAFVLPPMFCPRINQERLQKTIRDFRITENPPAVGTVATPDAGVFIHGLHAPAYAGLALAYAEWRSGMSGPQENMPKAREDALKALALDETQSMGHSVLGSIELYFDWNWAGAEKEFKRTLELNPNDYLTHSRYARLPVAMGRADEALTHVRTAMGSILFGRAITPSGPTIWRAATVKHSN